YNIIAIIPVHVGPACQIGLERIIAIPAVQISVERAANANRVIPWATRGRDIIVVARTVDGDRIIAVVPGQEYLANVSRLSPKGLELNRVVACRAVNLYPGRVCKPNLFEVTVG